MSSSFLDLSYLAVAVALLFVNGFFVAAEFALVKVRLGRIDHFVSEGRPFATTAKWLVVNLDAALAACQLGITIASLGLGWIGEPAIARLLGPAVHAVGIHSEKVVHLISFTVAFSIITAGHLVLGELAPKTFAIRRPEIIALWCAPFLKAFYVAFYPVLFVLNGAATLLVRKFGVDPADAGDEPHSENELRALLAQAHVHGELTRSEHQMLNAVFEFDDMVCRRVMIPRGDVVWFDINASISEVLDLACRAKHTRYPVCDGSLDQVLGVIHLKDLLVLARSEQRSLRDALRKPHYVPETMPVSRLLKYFQAVRQHLAFVVDEYGTVVGVATLDSVLAPIVGSVEDEFDASMAEIIPSGSGQYIVLGSTSIEVVERRLGLDFGEQQADTLSGLLVDELDRILSVGDVVDLPGATAEVVDVRGARAARIRLTVVAATTGEVDRNVGAGGDGGRRGEPT